MGAGWVLEKAKLRLTQPQVELELGLSLAIKIRSTFFMQMMSSGTNLDKIVRVNPGASFVSQWDDAVCFLVFHGDSSVSL